jgi:hypothetical protein
MLKKIGTTQEAMEPPQTFRDHLKQQRHDLKWKRNSLSRLASTRGAFGTAQSSIERARMGREDSRGEA